MNTVKAWVDKWIEQFGNKREDDDVMLILKSEKENTFYEGHFLDVPDTFYAFEVIENSRCVASSDKRREGAYILKVIADYDLDEVIEQAEELTKDLSKTTRSERDKKDLITKLRKDYADELKERAEKGFIEKSDVLDELINLMEHGEGNIVMGASGSGKSFSATAADILKLKKDKENKRSEAVSKAVSKRITDLCSEYGYSINCLSELSGITQSTVNDIVNCKSKNVGIITIKKLCEGLCITLEEFFTDPLFREFN